jgi:hypothetical protein
MPNQNSDQKKTAPEKPREAEHPATKGSDGKGGEKKWDIIDEHAWESFPASDAPSSWAGRDISPDEREAQAERDAREAVPKRDQKN